jgi:signal transduction histidine kinase
VELEVRNVLVDAASGPAPSSVPAGAAGLGHGILGMRERAQLAGGTLTAGAEGTSFRVRASMPITGAVR